MEKPDFVNLNTTTEVCLKEFGKLNILMQILSKSDIYFWTYCDFMFSKCHCQWKNYETQFISQKHAYTYTFDNYNLFLCKYHFKRLF